MLKTARLWRLPSVRPLWLTVRRRRRSRWLRKRDDGAFRSLHGKAADEVIVWMAILPAFQRAPIGAVSGQETIRYTHRGPEKHGGPLFSGEGTGWGGTDIQDPLYVIKEIDLDRCPEGMSLMVTETTGKNFAYYR